MVGQAVGDVVGDVAAPAEGGLGPLDRAPDAADARASAQHGLEGRGVAGDLEGLEAVGRGCQGSLQAPGPVGGVGAGLDGLAGATPERGRALPAPPARAPPSAGPALAPVPARPGVADRA